MEIKSETIFLLNQVIPTGPEAGSIASACMVAKCQPDKEKSSLTTPHHTLQWKMNTFLYK